jgi:8-oxo-dGTP diphosphatase
MNSGKVIHVVAAVVEREGRYLITQRSARAVFPLYWEFPGGKVEPGEDDQAALRREMLEELNAVVEVGPLLSQHVHEYQAFTIDFRVYRCSLTGNDLRCINVADFRWVPPGDLARYRFPPADEWAIADLVGEGR